MAMRGALHRKLMRLPMAYFDGQQTGRIMARVTSDVGSILMFIRSGIIQLISDLILSVAIAVVLIWLAVAARDRGAGGRAALRGQPAVLLCPPAQALRRDPRSGFGSLRSA